MKRYWNTSTLGTTLSGLQATQDPLLPTSGVQSMARIASSRLVDRGPVVEYVDINVYFVLGQRRSNS
jgi:hypothetical protein